MLTQILNEARPENIGSGLVKKVGMAHINKEPRASLQVSQLSPEELDARSFDDGTALVHEFFNAVGPNYLIWVCKQYILDKHFVFGDLHAWRETLEFYAEVCRAKSNQIERDINQFTSIDQLRTVLKKFEEDLSILDLVFPFLDKFVQEGQAMWIYKNAQYCIYFPKTWKASNEFYRVLNNRNIKSSLCVTYDDAFYEDYTYIGTFVLTISHDNAYCAFVGHHKSEFTDMNNNRDADVVYQVSKFPKLRPVIMKLAEKHNSIPVLVKLEPDRIEEYIPGIGKQLAAHNIKKTNIFQVMFEYYPLKQNPEMFKGHEKYLNDLKEIDTFHHENWSDTYVLGQMNNKDPMTNGLQFLVYMMPSETSQGRFFLAPGASLFEVYHPENVDSRSLDKTFVTGER